MTVSSRRPPKPPQLDQKISESRQPTAPTTSRMTPIRCRFTADVDVLTAQARIAPAAIRIRLTPIPIRSPPSQLRCTRQTQKPCKKVRPRWRSLCERLPSARRAAGCAPYSHPWAPTGSGAKGLEQFCPDGHVTAVLVLRPAGTADPVLPDDPLEVQHLECDQGTDRGEDLGRAHAFKVTSVRRWRNGPFGPFRLRPGPDDEARLRDRERRRCEHLELVDALRRFQLGRARARRREDRLGRAVPARVERDV